MLRLDRRTREPPTPRRRYCLAARRDIQFNEATSTLTTRKVPAARAARPHSGFCRSSPRTYVARSHRSLVPRSQPPVTRCKSRAPHSACSQVGPDRDVVLARSKSRMGRQLLRASHPASRAPVSIPDVIRGPGRVLPPVKDLRHGRGAQAADTPVTAPQIHGVLAAGAPQTAHAVWRTSGSTAVARSVGAQCGAWTAFAAPPSRGRPSQPRFQSSALARPT
jgi:hypothetical protein